MNSTDVKTALENNLRVNKSPLLKMAIDRITDLERENIKLKVRNAELAGQKASLERWFGEAKEIIRKYHKYNPSCEYSYEDISRQAESFLEGYKENGD